MLEEQKDLEVTSQYNNNKIGKIYKLHTDSERPNIQYNIQDPV